MILNSGLASSLTPPLIHKSYYMLQHAKNKFSFTNAHPFPQTQTRYVMQGPQGHTLHFSRSGMTSRYLVRDTVWLVSATGSALTGPRVQPRWALEPGVVGIEMGENAGCAPCCHCQDAAGKQGPMPAVALRHCWGWCPAKE